MRQKTFTVPFRRKRKGKTNYKKRLKLLLSKKPRLVIRCSLKNIACQIVEFDVKGDKVVAAANSSEIEKIGWKFNKGNIPAAYLTGLLIGTKSKQKKIKEAVLDIGFKTAVKGSRVFACLKGAVDGGLDIAYSEKIVPLAGRITGKHIADYATLLKKESNYEKRFADNIKKGADVSQITAVFEDVKNKIIKMKFAGVRK